MYRHPIEIYYKKEILLIAIEIATDSKEALAERRKARNKW
jgi:hypothetical protein